MDAFNCKCIHTSKNMRKRVVVTFYIIWLCVVIITGCNSQSQDSSKQKESENSTEEDFPQTEDVLEELDKKNAFVLPFDSAVKLRVNDTDLVKADLDEKSTAVYYLDISLGNINYACTAEIVSYYKYYDIGGWKMDSYDISYKDFRIVSMISYEQLYYYLYGKEGDWSLGKYLGTYFFGTPEGNKINLTEKQTTKFSYMTREITTVNSYECTAERGWSLLTTESHNEDNWKICEGTYEYVRDNSSASTPFYIVISNIDINAGTVLVNGKKYLLEIPSNSDDYSIPLYGTRLYFNKDTGVDILATSASLVKISDNTDVQSERCGVDKNGDGTISWDEKTYIILDSPDSMNGGLDEIVIESNENGGYDFIKNGRTRYRCTADDIVVYTDAIFYNCKSIRDIEVVTEMVMEIDIAYYTEKGYLKTAKNNDLIAITYYPFD